jgi:CRISPR-associated protein Csx17
MNPPLKIHAFPGINTDSLGHYLMSLGLLKAVASRWNSTRGFWRENVFYLAGDFTEAELLNHLLSDWQPQPYVKWWVEAQKSDKTGHAIQIERGLRSVAEVRVADTALIVTSRIVFNPIFGTNRKNQKRDLARAWKEARTLTEQPTSPDWLNATLLGVAEVNVPDFTKAGTWFIYNNKAFNSGLDWSREGSLSPWSFLLAMEGALLLTGGAGRRLSARASAYALFPFLSQPLQPEAHAELEHGEAEFWAPTWSAPATLREVKLLFVRGLARIGGRAASAPHEFAIAALGAGTDAGVTSFSRFEIRQTTSAKVYEALPRGEFHLPTEGGRGRSQHHSTAIMEVLGPRWFDRLPSEPHSKRSKKKFTGLRGPIERLLLGVAQTPENPEAWQALILRLAESQSWTDRNLSLRKVCRAVPRLGIDWFRHAFPDFGSPEIRIAAAFSSLGAGSDYTAACNIYGIEIRGKTLDFVRPGRPQRAVWHNGDPVSSFLGLTERRLTDSAKGKLPALYSPLRLTASEIDFFLSGETCDLAEVQKWVPPLSLIGWSEKDRWRNEPSGFESLDPTTLLWAFFKPFFHPLELPIGTRSFFIGDAGPKPAFARQLFALLRSGSVAEAIAFTQAGWQAQGHRVIIPPVPKAIDATRLAAGLALPISSARLARLAGRWLEPSKTTQP